MLVLFHWLDRWSNIVQVYLLYFLQNLLIHLRNSGDHAWLRKPTAATQVSLPSFNIVYGLSVDLLIFVVVKTAKETAACSCIFSNCLRIFYMHNQKNACLTDCSCSSKGLNIQFDYQHPQQIRWWSAEKILSPIVWNNNQWLLGREPFPTI